MGKKIINIPLGGWFFLLNHTDFRHCLRTETVTLRWEKGEQWSGYTGSPLSLSP